MFLQGGGRPHMCFREFTLFSWSVFGCFDRTLSCSFGLLPSVSDFVKIGRTDEAVSGLGSAALAFVHCDGAPWAASKVPSKTDRAGFRCGCALSHHAEPYAYGWCRRSNRGFPRQCLGLSAPPKHVTYHQPR